MTAAHPSRSASAQRPVQSVSTDDAYLSALFDGEVALDEFNEHGLWPHSSLDARATSQCYALIGQALSGVSPERMPVAPQTFLLGVQARLAQASQGETASATAPLPVTLVAAVHRPASAANDSVFRWKLVSGVASLVAVMAVSWSVLGSTIAGDPGVALGSQPVVSQTVAPERVAIGQSLPVTVLVSTDQGPVLRDSRLEQMLAEHRHYGGVSALHMPAGFLRDATRPAETQP